MDFFEAVQSRRSVREYTNEPVPPEVIEKALDAALLAPNSSNMQTWEFWWVRSPEKKAELVKICLSQSAARTAQELVVAVAMPSKWPQNAAEMLKAVTEAGSPQGVRDYYGKLIPFIYGFQILAPLKFLIFFIRGWFKPTPRSPWSWFDRREVAVKSCALACENFMLAISAQGYDTCPMEGADESRLRKLLGLSCSSRLVMVMSVGKRAPKGIWGKQIRFPREWAVKYL